jgi:hypothetical protein
MVDPRITWTGISLQSNFTGGMHQLTNNHSTAIFTTAGNTGNVIANGLTMFSESCA